VIRLFVSADLGPGAAAALTDEHAHYLTHVMRLPAGAAVAVFNGRDGEWAARIEVLGKRDIRLIVESRRRDQTAGPDIDLAIALVKRAPLELIVEKSTELGV